MEKAKFGKNQFRVKLIIYPRFQYLLIGINWVLIIGTFIITCYEASRTFSKFNAMGAMIQLPSDHPYFKLIEFESNGMYSSLIISFLLAILITGITTVLISHRLAGPIVRLKGYFGEIAKTGAVTYPLKFRDGDYFEDLPSIINLALEELSEAKLEAKSDPKDGTGSALKL